MATLPTMTSDGNPMSLTARIIKAFVDCTPEGENRDVFAQELEEIFREHEAHWKVDRDACSSLFVKGEGDEAVVVFDHEDGIQPQLTEKVVAVRTLEYWTLDPEYDQPDQYIGSMVERRFLTPAEKSRLQEALHKGEMSIKDMKSDYV